MEGTRESVTDTDDCFINKIFCEMAEYLEAEKKQEIFAKYGKSNTDT